jgi:G3E family GTPase
LAASLATRIKGIQREIDPDLLFIEPSEMVVTRELRNVSAMGLRDVTYEVGPFITLVDGPTFNFSWQERRALLLGQIADADLVVLSRSDLIDSSRLEEIGKTLNEYLNSVLGLSTPLGLGVKEVAEMVENFS